MKFEDCNWHDLVIKDIRIDRCNPGKKDVIEFAIELENGNILKLLFGDVYWANLSLNFGIVALESISKAYIANERDFDLCNFRDKWKSILKNDIDTFKMYIFELSSTNSVIKIIAKNALVYVD